MHNSQNSENERYLNKIDRHEANLQKIVYGFWAAGVIITVLGYFNITLNNEIKDIRGDVDGLKVEVAELETTIKDSREEFELVKDSLKAIFITELDSIVQIKIDEYPPSQISNDISELNDIISALSDNIDAIDKKSKERDNNLKSRMITGVTWHMDGNNHSPGPVNNRANLAKGRKCLKVIDTSIPNSEDNFLCFELNNSP